MIIETRDDHEEEIIEHYNFCAEVNTIILPFFLFGNRENTGAITYKGTIKEEGKIIEFSWTVSANLSYGLPGAFDWQVFRAIESLISDMPKPVENPVTFSFYDLCRKMRINTSGANYDNIKNSIRKIRATTIQSKKAYYLKEKKRRISTEIGFSFYDMCVFVNEELPDGKIADTNYLWLNPFYLSNINNNYVKPFDSDYYWSLRKLISRRLYEILSVKLYGLPDLDVTLRQNYARLCEQLRITPQKYLSWARRRFDPAHEELIKTGFLKSVKWEKRGKRPETWFILYTPGPRAIEEIKRAKGERMELPEPALTDEQEIIVMALEARGVIYKIAKQLVLEYDQEKIQQVIEYTDWYRNQPNKVQNWGAYIAELVRDPDFSPSPDFRKAKAEEEEKEQEEALMKEAERILEERMREALESWSDEKLIEEGVERAVRAREALVRQGMNRPYTEEEIERIRREIAEGLPKDEEGRRRWLMMNGGERFNLRIIMEELRREQGEMGRDKVLKCSR